MLVRKYFSSILIVFWLCLTTEVRAFDLSWQDNSDNEDGFKIYRKLPTEHNFTLLATTGPNVTNFSDPSRIPGTSYRVAAFNSIGESSAIRGNTGVIALGWNQPGTTLADGYRIERDTGSGFASLIIRNSTIVATGSGLVSLSSVGGSVRAINDTITADGRYCYRIQGFNAAGDSPWSDVNCLAITLNFDDVWTIPVAPTGLGVVVE